MAQSARWIEVVFDSNPDGCGARAVDFTTFFQAEPARGNVICPEAPDPAMGKTVMGEQSKHGTHRDGSNRSEVTAVRHSSTRTADSWAPGRTLSRGRFVIKERVAKGGVGTVYRVYDEVRRTHVALKVLHVQDAPALYALKQEFRIRRDLVHPNLVRLHELFVENKLCFFTMDLILGVPFNKYVRPSDRTSFDQERLESGFRQLVEAVSFLHSEGKVHRDLKSANVLVTEEGRVILVDFGLTLDALNEDAAHFSGSIEGTPGYLAPELTLGNKPSFSSDAFALGAMMYECLTGWLPGGPSASSPLMRKPIEPPSTLQAEIDETTERLCLGLLDPDPESRLGLEDIASYLGQSGQTIPQRDDHHLLGRENELAQLEAAYLRFQASNQPALVWLSGRPGIGKSALLEHFLRSVHGSCLVLTGRCHERESVPYKALDEVVDDLTRQLARGNDEQVLELIPPPDAMVLSRLFSSIRRVPALSGFSTDEDESDPRELRKRAHTSLARVFQRLSRKKPVLIAIDDLQWGDPDSAKLLQELCSLSEQAKCLFVLSHRTGEQLRSPCLAPLLEGPRRLSSFLETTTIRLQELHPEKSRALAMTLLGKTSNREQKADWICREANGNPLLLSELARHIEKLPNVSMARSLGLRELVQQRLHTVSPISIRAFEVICIAGSPVSESVVSEVLGATDISDPVVELQAAHLIRERSSVYPDALVPYHDSLREAYVGGMTEEEQQHAHSCLAHAHEKHGVRDAEAIALHYAAAGNEHRASRWAEIAGDVAAGALAFDRAAGLYRLALSSVDTGHATILQVKLAEALADAGRGSEAAPLFLKAAEEADTREALQYRRRAAEQWLVSGRVLEGRAVLEQVFREVKLPFPRSPRRALLDLWKLRLELRLHGASPRRTQGEPSELELLRIDACRAAWPISFVSTVHAAALQARFLCLALKANEPYRLALGLGMEAVQRSIDGGRQRPAAEELHMKALELTERLDSAHATAFLDFVDGHIGYMCGEWSRAVQALERAEDRLTRKCRCVTWELNSTRFFWGNALSHLGKYGELKGLVVSWLRDAEDREDDYAKAGFRLMQARVVLHIRDLPSHALSEIELALEEWPSKSLGVHRFMAELLRIQAHIYQDEPREALQAASNLERRFFRSPMARIQLCRIHTLAQGALAAVFAAASQEAPKQRSKLITHAHRLRKKLQREGVPWADAYACYLSATAEHLEGKDQSAADKLDESTRRFRQCGMQFVAAATQWQHARLTGAAQEQQRQVFVDQGAVAPESTIKLFAPGWD